MTAQVCPRRARARGREPATSASPPVLAKPTTSEAATRILYEVEAAVTTRSRCRGLGEAATGSVPESGDRRQSLWRAEDISPLSLSQGTDASRSPGRSQQSDVE